VNLQDIEFIGELALSGDIRGVPGLLPSAIACHQANRQLILPEDNQQEAALVESDAVFAKHLTQVTAHLLKLSKLPTCVSKPTALLPLDHKDMRDVKGPIPSATSLGSRSGRWS